MHGAQRDVGRLVFGQQHDFVTHGDLGGAAHHDPVLGTVVVHLQAQGCLGLDHDALDLEARAHVDRVVPAPGAMNTAMQRAFRARTAFQGRHDLLDILALVAVCDQHGIGRLDHNHVVQSHGGHQAARGMHQRVAAALDQGITLRGIALLVTRADLPDGIPGAQIGPTCIQGHHAHGKAGLGARRALLHHGVVHRLRWHNRELGLARAHELVVGRTHVKSGTRGLQDVRTELVEGGQPARCTHHEHPTVPEIAAIGQVSLGGVQVGLLDKSRHGAHALRIGGTCPNVAKPRLGAIRRDAQDHDVTTRSRVDRLAQCRREGRFVGHGLVSRRHHQDRILPLGGRLQRRQRHGRRGVAAHGLQQQAGWFGLELSQLVEHQESVLFVAHHTGRSDLVAISRQRLKTQVRQLEQRLVALQHQELLGVHGPRQRPQPGAGTAGHDDG